MTYTKANRINTTVYRRTDGRGTVELKLVGWPADQLDAVAAHLQSSNDMAVREVGAAIASDLEVAFDNDPTPCRCRGEFHVCRPPYPT